MRIQGCQTVTTVLDAGRLLRCVVQAPEDQQCCEGELQAARQAQTSLATQAQTAMAEGMRKRGGGGAISGAASSMYTEEVRDEEEEKPLVGGPALAPADESEKRDCSSSAKPALNASSGAVSKASFKMGLVIEKIRELDMDDVYRYWSVFQGWLADVPSKLGTRCPPLAALGLSRPPDLTQEQLEKLDKWCENNVGVACTAEEHTELLMKLWAASFPDADVKPEIPDPLVPLSTPPALAPHPASFSPRCSLDSLLACAPCRDPNPTHPFPPRPRPPPCLPTDNGSDWDSKAMTPSQILGQQASCRWTC